MNTQFDFTGVEINKGREVNPSFLFGGASPYKPNMLRQQNHQLSPIYHGNKNLSSFHMRMNRHSDLQGCSNMPKISYDQAHMSKQEGSLYLQSKRISHFDNEECHDFNSTWVHNRNNKNNEYFPEPLTEDAAYIEHQRRMIENNQSPFLERKHPLQRYCQEQQANIQTKSFSKSLQDQQRKFIQQKESSLKTKTRYEFKNQENPEQNSLLEESNEPVEYVQPTQRAKRGRPALLKENPKFQSSKEQPETILKQNSEASQNKKESLNLKENTRSSSDCEINKLEQISKERKPKPIPKSKERKSTQNSQEKLCIVKGRKKHSPSGIHEQETKNVRQKIVDPETKEIDSRRRTRSSKEKEDESLNDSPRKKENDKKKDVPALSSMKAEMESSSSIPSGKGTKKRQVLTMRQLSNQLKKRSHPQFEKEEEKNLTSQKKRMTSPSTNLMRNSCSLASNGMSSSGNSLEGQEQFQQRGSTLLQQIKDHRQKLMGENVGVRGDQNSEHSTIQDKMCLRSSSQKNQARKSCQESASEYNLSTTLHSKIIESSVKDLSSRYLKRTKSSHKNSKVRSSQSPNSSSVKIEEEEEQEGEAQEELQEEDMISDKKIPKRASKKQIIMSEKERKRLMKLEKKGNEEAQTQFINLVKQAEYMGNIYSIIGSRVHLLVSQIKKQFSSNKPISPKRFKKQFEQDQQFAHISNDFIQKANEELNRLINPNFFIQSFPKKNR